MWDTKDNFIFNNMIELQHHGYDLKESEDESGRVRFFIVNTISWKEVFAYDTEIKDEVEAIRQIPDVLVQLRQTSSIHHHSKCFIPAQSVQSRPHDVNPTTTEEDT